MADTLVLSSAGAPNPWILDPETIAKVTKATNGRKQRKPSQKKNKKNNDAQQPVAQPKPPSKKAKANADAQVVKKKVLEQLIDLEKTWQDERRSLLENMMVELELVNQECARCRFDSSQFALYIQADQRRKQIQEDIRELREDHETQILQQQKERLIAFEEQEKKIKREKKEQQPTSTQGQEVGVSDVQPSEAFNAFWQEKEAIDFFAEQPSSSINDSVKSEQSNNSVNLELHQPFSALGQELSSCCHVYDTTFAQNESWISNTSTDHLVVSRSIAPVQSNNSSNSKSPMKRELPNSSNVQQTVTQKRFRSRYILPRIEDEISTQYVQSDICFNCRQPLVVHPDEGTKSCYECGYADEDAEQPIEMNGTEDVDQNRDSQFDKVLANFEKIDYAKIDEPIQCCRRRWQEEGHDETELVTCAWVIETLKQNKMHDKYAMYKIQITSHLNGTPLPFFDKHEKALIKREFQRTKRPFAMFHGSRTNFISYPYVFVKICQILALKYEQFARFIPWISKPKRGKRHDEQEMIWKRICEYLDWIFMPSEENTIYNNRKPKSKK